MLHKEIIDEIKPELDKAIEFLERELSKIRTGRVSASLVEDIEVECFEKKFLLKQLAAISTPKKREILIQPWDGSYIEPIEKAISRSGLGTNPVVEGEIIRLSFPSPSTEYRENLLQLISQKREEVRKTIRKWRGEAWEKIQDLTQAGEIREDDKYRAKDELQDLIDLYNEKIEKLIEKKNKEIME
jgi:ribosome recycling factor